MDPDLSFEESIEQALALLGDHGSDADLHQANLHINQAILIRPGDRRAWLLKSQVLSSLKDDPAALATAEMSARIAPRDAEVHLTRAAVLTDMARYDEGLVAVDLAFSCCGDGDDWLLEDLFLEKATLLDYMDRPDEAIATYEEGMRRCPDSALLRDNLDPLSRERLRRRFTVIDGGRS